MGLVIQENLLDQAATSAKTDADGRSIHLNDAPRHSNCRVRPYIPSTVVGVILRGGTLMPQGRSGDRRPNKSSNCKKTFGNGPLPATPFPDPAVFAAAHSLSPLRQSPRPPHWLFWVPALPVSERCVGGARQET